MHLARGSGLPHQGAVELSNLLIQALDPKIAAKRAEVAAWQEITQSAVTPVKTGVQEILKGLKILDSGFRRNDSKRMQTNFFTPSGREGWG